MGKYEQIRKAMSLFGLNDVETVREVRRKINDRIREWHPDTAADKEAAKEKSAGLILARQAVLDYLDSYRISFAKEEVEKYLSMEEIWLNRMRQDPVWGDGTE